MPEIVNGLEGFDDPIHDFVLEHEDPQYVRPTLHTADRLNALAQYWVDKYGGSENGLNFTREQELMLAGRVQTGLAAQAALAEEGSEHDTAELAHQVCVGLRAERALVENNLRFAFVYARESVGITHSGVRDRFMQGQARFDDKETELPDDEAAAPVSRRGGWKPGRPQRSLGTYKPLSSMKSPRASLEDRYNMAAVGLLKAARKFRPENAKSSFVGFAAWEIQNEIDRGRYEAEHSGARLPVNVAEKLNSYFKENRSVTADHVVPSEVEDLLRVEESREYPYDFGNVQEGGVEELHDPWGEDDRAESIADVIDTEFDDTAFSLAHELSSIAIHKALETLSDREVTLVRLRFGIGKCACHAEVEDFEGPHTLEQISAVFGVTRSRINQLEHRALSLLRHPSRANSLKDLFAYLGEADRAVPNTVWRGDAIQLIQGKRTHKPDPEHPQDFSAMAPFRSEEQLAAWQEHQAWLEAQKHRESWQAYADEPWDMPLRDRPHAATEEQAEDMADLLEKLPAFFYSKRFGIRTDTMFPLTPLNQFKESAGRAILSAEQISYIWEEFMDHTYPRLSEALGDDFDPDRVGQLFSRIISEYINDNDTPVRLTIPSHANGQIGYLASNLGLGRVEITGIPGMGVAAWNKGFADVKVFGSTGDYAGAMMKDNARLTITGSAGHGMAIGADGEAEFFVGRADSTGRHGEHVAIEYRYSR